MGEALVFSSCGTVPSLLLPLLLLPVFWPTYEGSEQDTGAGLGEKQAKEETAEDDDDDDDEEDEEDEEDEGGGGRLAEALEGDACSQLSGQEKTATTPKSKDVSPKRSSRDRALVD